VSGIRTQLAGRRPRRDILNLLGGDDAATICRARQDFAWCVPIALRPCTQRRSHGFKVLRQPACAHSLNRRRRQVRGDSTRAQLAGRGSCRGIRRRQKGGPYHSDEGADGAKTLAQKAWPRASGSAGRGNDVFACAGRSPKRSRRAAGGGPSLIETLPYRLSDHRRPRTSSATLRREVKDGGRSNSDSDSDISCRADCGTRPRNKLAARVHAAVDAAVTDYLGRRNRRRSRCSTPLPACRALQRRSSWRIQPA